MPVTIRNKDHENSVQLDLNLYAVRRELTKFLDEYQFNDCVFCNRLKCRCEKYISDSSSLSSNNFHYDMKEHLNKFIRIPPPANALPVPDVPVLISTPHNSKKMSQFDSWVNQSTIGVVITRTNEKKWHKTILNKVNYSWPPSPKSIWSAQKATITSEKEDEYLSKSGEDNGCTAEQFFSCYCGQRKTKMCEICTRYSSRFFTSSPTPICATKFLLT